jgi:hypothetical protein
VRGAERRGEKEERGGKKKAGRARASSGRYNLNQQGTKNTTNINILIVDNIFAVLLKSVYLNCPDQYTQYIY